MNFNYKLKHVLQVPIVTLALLLLANFSADADSGDGLPVVIGQDSSGAAKAFAMDQGKLTSAISTSLQTVEDSFVPAMNSNLSSNILMNNFELRTVGVGVGLTGQFGLGPLLNITVNARLRLVFTNSLNPIYPD